jgi:hypothetical protein
MLTLFWFTFWVGLAVLAFAAGVSLRVRLRDEIHAPSPVVDDDAVRAILDTGRLATDEDEPLQAREIDEEERRFWSENWDEPEEL